MYMSFGKLTISGGVKQILRTEERIQKTQTANGCIKFVLTCSRKVTNGLKKIDKWFYVFKVFIDIKDFHKLYDTSATR